MKIIFISWAPYCSRSDNIAKKLGGKSYLVYYGMFGSNYWTIFFKYLFQFIKTYKIFLKERPDIILTMSPPIFAALPAYFWTRFNPAGFIIDAHTGAIIDKRFGRRALFLHKFLSKYAITTIVTNEYLKSIINSWNCHATIISDVPVEFKNTAPLKLKPGFSITLINSFAIDEPIETFLAAAERLSEINFYVTGDLNDARKNKKTITPAPSNVTFTDFLPNDEYTGLLKASDAVMVITLDDYTMQRGGYEAVSLQKPLIISNWEILRKTFYKGAVFIDNTSEGIEKGILEMKENIEKYKEDVIELKKDRAEIWNNTQQRLELLMSKYLEKRSCRQVGT
ncbi:MAG: hypothetical protein AB1414_01955 [bacterium]